MSPAGQLQEFQDTLEADLKDFKSLNAWSDDAPGADGLITKAIQHSCQSTAALYYVLEALIDCLGEAAPEVQDAEAIQLGEQRFRSRRELKVWCLSMLRTYAEGDLIQPEDAQKIMELLAYHPRGVDKAEGCVAIRAGRHPTFNHKCFFVVRKDGKEEDFSYIRCVDNALTYEGRCQVRICQAILTILQVNPAAKMTFTEIVAKKFPQIRTSQSGGLGVSVQKHRNWAQAMLMLCGRMTSLSQILPVLLLRRMVHIDSEISSFERKTLDDQSQNPSSEVHGEPGSYERHLSAEEVDVYANVLDCNMMLFFEYLQRHLATTPKTKEDIKLQADLVTSMLNIFVDVVLNTHKVKCVQFLWFYIASLKPRWTEAFLQTLLCVGAEKAQGVEKRLLAFAYIASFLARAKFLNPKYAVKTVEFLVMIGRDVFQALETGQKSFGGLEVLVSVVQAACYIITWLGEGFEQEKDEEGVNGLDRVLPDYGQAMPQNAFTPLLLSSHKPFAHISRPVAEEFLKSMRPRRPSLSEVLENHLQEVEISTGLRGTCFFPFDPYRLAHSNIFLMGIYRVWEHGDDGFEEESHVDDEFGAGERREAAEAESMEDVDEEDFTDEADVASRGFTPLVGPSPAFRPTWDMDTAMSPAFGPRDMEDEDFEALPAAAIDTDSFDHRDFYSPPYQQGYA